MGKKPKWTKSEESLLLYLETRAVDHAGRVNQHHINDTDRATIEVWVNQKFIKFGRIALADAGNGDGASWVELTPGAWREAARLRRARGVRKLAGRNYRRTNELSGAEESK